MLTYIADNKYWHFHYNWIWTEDGYPSCFMGKNIHEAITSAVLQAIEKEAQDEVP